MKPVVVDFETHAIARRPDYPPKPVGVSIMYPGKKPTYYAFGHPTNNNCSEDEARGALQQAWGHSGGVLFHNAKFDLDVAQTNLGLPRLPWWKTHDTMLLLFLSDPHAATFALKPSSERILDMPSTERDGVREWLIENNIVSTASKSWGAFIAGAPGDIVGAYANGDVVRTAKLFDVLINEIKRRKMMPAYEREQHLLPILLDMERRGIHVSQRLIDDTALYQQVLIKLDGWIRRRLKAPKLNISSGDELLSALIAAQKVDLTRVGLTPTLVNKDGSPSYKTDKETLSAAVTDRVLSSMLGYRASLQTCVGTFMEPWLETALASGGKIFTSWSQVRQTGKKMTGAVTGRLSSSPNFQNIPKEFPAFWSHEERHLPRAKRRGLPRAPLNLPELPQVRSYIIPAPGHALVGRDYSQQELRVLAHYAGGELLQAYLDNPRLDIHTHAAKLMAEMLSLGELSAEEFDKLRKKTKTIGFGLIYGMGIGLLAQRTGTSHEEARQFKEAYLAIFPGLRDLTKDMRRRANMEEPIRTWGGREYYCEPAAVVKGEVRTFDYKLINILVQGSSADCTKEAVINYRMTQPDNHHLILTIHDELLVECPVDEIELAHEVLGRAMGDVNFALPMLSDGETSTSNWSVMEPHE